MTFEYSEEMIQQIESVGLTAEQFDEIILKGIQWLKEIFEKMLEIIREAIKVIGEALSGFAEEIKKVEPRHRYKIVKKLGVQNYEVFFKRKMIHRARSCC